MTAFTPLKKLSQRLDGFIQGRLWLKVIIGMFLGILTGLVLGPDLGWFEQSLVVTITAWLAVPGQVFLALIQMIVVPLVIASIVRGLASNNDPEALKKIGLLAIGFILLSTVAASVVGIGIAQWIEPGKMIDVSYFVESTPKPNNRVASLPTLAEMPDKVMSIFPKNPLASMVSGEMLQVILFSAVLGFALLAIPAERARPLMDLFGALQEVSIRVVSWAMVIAPFAVFGLITRLVANLGMDVLAGMLVYVLTVLLGLLIVGVLYSLVLKIAGKMSLSFFFKKTKELLLLAFSTSSSAAVMPLSLKVTETELGVRESIARFLIPLGATINMAGTALYQGIATVFLAQVFQVDLTLTNYIFIVTMAVAASVGSPATPGAGIVILSLVLEGVGIPAAGVALLLGVDRILDMCRTAVNVFGDVVLCTVAEKIEQQREPAVEKTLKENA